MGTTGIGLYLLAIADATLVRMASTSESIAARLKSWRRTLPSLPEQRDQFLDFPDMIGDARFHRGRNAKRLVDATEVVVHEVQRDVVCVVLRIVLYRIKSDHSLGTASFTFVGNHEPLN